MDDMKIAKWLSGTDSKSDDPGRVRYYYGTAVEDSIDGKVKVKTDGMMITQDDQDYVELGCYGNIEAGSVVRIASVNSSPAVDGDIGWGDRLHQNVVYVGNAVSDLETEVDGMGSLVDDAAKVATNFLDFDETGTNGLIVGNLTDDTLGQNVQIDAESVNIREGSTAFATLAKDLIELGKTLKSAIIRFCQGALELTAETKGVAGGLNATLGTLKVVDGSSHAKIELMSTGGYANAKIRADNGTDMIESHAYSETTTGSSNSEVRSQWYDNGSTGPGSRPYVRNSAAVTNKATASDTHASLMAQFQQGSSGTQYTATLGVRATGASGSETAISASFHDSANSTAVTVYLKPIYRFYNPYDFRHVWTSNPNDSSLSGWTNEGIAWYAFV